MSSTEYDENAPSIWSTLFRGKRVGYTADDEYRPVEYCDKYGLPSGDDTKEFFQLLHMQKRGNKYTMSFTKHDGAKMRPTLFPVEAVERILPVLEYGAQKYAVDNWRLAAQEPGGLQRYKDAFERHWMEYKKNPSSVDEESGLPHLYHAACNMVFLTALEDVR